MDWVKEFINSNEDLHVSNFDGLENLIMIAPRSGNANYWLTSADQRFELSESGKRLFIVDYSNKDLPYIAKTFNMKSIVLFGYTK